MVIFIQRKVSWMCNVISEKPTGYSEQCRKPPGISIFAKIATEHVLGHEIFVFEYVDKAVKMPFIYL